MAYGGEPLDGYGSEPWLVEIFDHDDASPRDVDVSLDANARLVKAGQVVAELEDGCCLVETFEGDAVTLPRNRLRTFTPAPGAKGGFDATWPSGQQHSSDFGEHVTHQLQHQSFCVIQVPTRPVDRLNAVEAASPLTTWTRLLPEFEASYMGLKPKGKVQWMSTESESMQVDALRSCDAVMSELSSYLIPLSRALGYDAQDRSTGLLRLPCTDRTEEDHLVHQISVFDVVDGKLIEEDIAFLQRRKLCMIYFVAGNGGTLRLVSLATGSEIVDIPVVESRIVVFQPDVLDFCFAPDQGCLAIQAWILRESFLGEIELDSGYDTNFSRLDLPPAPEYGRTGEMVNCTAVNPNLPGDVHGGWVMLSSCC